MRVYCHEQATEKELKTKAFSREGLAQSRLGPKDRERLRMREWLNDTCDRLNSQVDEWEADLEQEHIKSKKDIDHGHIELLEESIRRHKSHSTKLEQVLRCLENDQISPEDVADIQELVDDYIERGQEDFDEFEDDDFIYENLTEKMEAAAAAGTTVRSLDQGGGLTGDDESAKEEEQRRERERAAALAAKAQLAATNADVAHRTGSAPPVEGIASVGVTTTTTTTTTTATSSSNSTTNAQGVAAGVSVTGLQGGGLSGQGSTGASTLVATVSKTRTGGAAGGVHDGGGGMVDGGDTISKSGVNNGTNNNTSPLDGMGGGGVTSKVASTPRKTPVAVPVGGSGQQHNGAVDDSSATPSYGTVARAGTATTAPTAASTASPQQQQQQSVWSQGGAKVVATLRQTGGDSGPGSDSENQQQLAWRLQGMSVSGLATEGSNKDGMTGDTSLAQQQQQQGGGSGLLQHAQHCLRMLQNTFTTCIPRPKDGDWVPLEKRLAMAGSPGMLNAVTQNTPSSYPQTKISQVDLPLLYEKMDTDTLFFTFYCMPGSYQQYLAARQLKKLSWRYHKVHKAWFQRHETPWEIKEDYEQGAYVYFDHSLPQQPEGTEGSNEKRERNTTVPSLDQVWTYRVKSDFKIEYGVLENEI